MVRSEALIKAQKKYMKKIKEEGGEKYEKFKERNRIYQKKTIEKYKNNPVLYEMKKKNNRQYAKLNYKKHRNIKLKKMKDKNDKKIEDNLLNLPELEDEFKNLFLD